MRSDSIVWRGGAPRSWSAEAMVSAGSAAPEERAGAEPAAAAHGDEGVLAIAPLEFVDGLGDEDGARAPERVADGDGSTVGVDPGPVGFQVPLPGQDHRGERLVDLENV